MEDKFIALTHTMIRDTRMTMQEKIIYLEILNLSSLDKGCIASNNHFERSFGISKKSVSNTISSLVKKGFIESRLSDRNHTRVLSIKSGQVSIKSGQVSIKSGQVSIKSGETKENIQVNIQEKKEEAIKEPINYKNILEVFNFYADKYNLSKIREITGKRKNKLLSRFKENQNFKEILNEAFIKIGQSSFLLGKNNRSWKVDFDWLIENDTNIIKICEDKYKDGNESVGEWK